MLRTVATAVLGTMILTSNLAQAQSSANDAVDVSVNVIAALTLVSFGAVDFGDVPPGEAIISILEGASFQASGQPSAEIEVNRPNTLALAHATDASTEDLMFVVDFQGHAANDSEAASAIGDGSVVTLNPDGDYYFWLGGSLTVPADAVRGLYAGEFVVDVVFN